VTLAATDHIELYGYDNKLDYLTGASYDNGSTSTTWTYDAAGNRTDSGTSFDNLNRMWTYGANTFYDNDILGNRTRFWVGTGTISQFMNYSWDPLNRMTSCSPQIGSTNYAYRADGMRVEKAYTSGELSFIPGTPVGDIDTLYRYDGQMPMETYALHDDGTTNLTRHGLGARGIDYAQNIHYNGTSTTTTDAFPIYDAHGNEVATLSRNLSDISTPTLSNQRGYDVWGGVRSGSATGGPRGRYCGNLGHVQDDETGLIYMRARYYEPGTGRFISQDAAREGLNYFVYCNNEPVSYFDRSGSSGTWGSLLNNFRYALLYFFKNPAESLTALMRVRAYIDGIVKTSTMLEKAMLQEGADIIEDAPPGNEETVGLEIESSAAEQAAGGLQGGMLAVAVEYREQFDIMIEVVEELYP
jgi:RHS repeat-associated protein